MLADLDAAASVHIGQNRTEQAVEASPAAAELVTFASRVEVLLERLLMVFRTATGSALVALLTAAASAACGGFGRVNAVGTGAALGRA